MRKIDFIVLTFFSIVALTTMQGCKKKEEKIEAPKLTFKALSSTSLLQFKDSLTVTFSYEDNDGDIGFYDADSSSVYIQDKRLTHPDLYYLKPLNPPNLKPRIKGDIQLGLRNMFLLGSGSSETTSFTIWIKDRKGNISNSIVTPEITIHQ
jgi:hypothetical protein